MIGPVRRVGLATLIADTGRNVDPRGSRRFMPDLFGVKNQTTVVMVVKGLEGLTWFRTRGYRSMTGAVGGRVKIGTCRAFPMD